MLKIGSFKQKVPANTQLFIEGQGEFAIIQLDENHKPITMIGRSNERQCKFTVRKDMELLFQTEPKKFISIDARSVPGYQEEVSDIPYEIPDDNQANLSLEEKLKFYLAEMVAEKYGPESKEFDTFEDAMDFDEEDDNILSGFEVPEIIEEKPDEPIQAKDNGEETGATDTDPPKDNKTIVENNKEDKQTTAEA